MYCKYHHKYNYILNLYAVIHTIQDKCITIDIALLLLYITHTVAVSKCYNSYPKCISLQLLLVKWHLSDHKYNHVVSLGPQ